MKKKILSVILSVCVALSCLTIGSVSTSAAEAGESESVGSGSQEPLDNIQGSAVLHCFNWSYNNIKNNLQAIKDAGYTAVQTSPVQKPKDYSSSYTDQSGQWWKLYQPLSLTISDTGWLGTKAQLKALCTEAEKYDIKVIVDIVANHVANDGTDNGTYSHIGNVDSSLRNSSYYHTSNDWANDNSRYDMTQGHIGMPDLNTGNSSVQNMVKSLLIDCINQGVDGFRFDAAKHIELPNDSGCGSNFWPTVINGSQSSTSNNIYYYGEILNTAGTSINNYTQYMSVTDNYTSDSLLVAANNSNASGLSSSTYSKGAGASKSVLWAESHDTYMGNSGSAGINNTKSVNNNAIIKAWGIIGSRSGSTSLFFARPAATMGSASSDTTWKSKAVAEVNKFKNYFDGDSEYLSSSNGVAYNERGTKGVAIVKLNGSGSVSLKANKMEDGEYIDQVSGNTFTVKNSTITGTVGSTGVAVVYNPAPLGPSAAANPGSTSYKTDTLKVTLSYNNATSGKYSINGGAYQSFTNGQTITIGSGVEYGTTTTLSVIASDASSTSDPVTYTYTKVDPTLAQRVYFDNSGYKWSAVYAYIYTDSSNMNAVWPGLPMTLDNEIGLYTIEVPESMTNGYVIFTESFSSSNRYPAADEQGLELNGNNMIFKANHVWEPYTGTQPSTQATTKATQPATQATQATVPSGSNVLIGDVNQDKTITISDATEVQMHIAGMKTLTGDSLTAAEVDGDEIISVKDVTAIQCYLVRLSSGAYNCGKYTGGGSVDPTQATQATVPSDDGNYVYFKNTSNWSTVNAYVWSESNEHMMSWPGVAMTSVGSGVYRYEVPTGATKIIFTNGSDQTDDLNIPGYGYIYDYSNKNWSKYSGGSTVVTEPVESDGSYVYFKNTSNWSTVNAYVWSESNEQMMSWPGVAMTSVGSGVYRYEVPSGATKIIFNNGSEQTDDLNIPGYGYIYDYSNKNWSKYSG